MPRRECGAKLKNKEKHVGIGHHVQSCTVLLFAVSCCVFHFGDIEVCNIYCILLLREGTKNKLKDAQRI